MCPLGFNFNGADPSLKLPGITGYDDNDEDHNHDTTFMVMITRWCFDLADDCDPCRYQV